MGAAGGQGPLDTVQKEADFFYHMDSLTVAIEFCLIPGPQTHTSTQCTTQFLILYIQ